MAHDVTKNHGRGITCKACPSTGHVAITRNKQHVDGNEHGATDARKVSPPNGFVDELVPKREVKVDAHHDFGSHNDGHDTQSLPVIAPDETAENVDITHHNEESQQGEDNEILHGLGVSVAIVLVFRLAKDERFVGITEGLRYHGHYHGYLTCRSVDAQLRVRITSFIYIREQYLVGRLVKYACNAQYQYGPAIRKHTFKQGLIENVGETAQLFIETKGDASRTNEVDVEGVTCTYVWRINKAHPLMSAFVKGWQQQIVNQIERNVAANEKQFEGGKLDGALLIAKVGKGNALECVDGYRRCHNPNVRWMVGIAHCLRDGMQEKYHHCDEKGGSETHGEQDGGIYPLWIFVALIGETEKSGLHSVCQ